MHPERAPQSTVTETRTLPSVFDNIEVSGRVGAIPVVDIKGPVTVSGFKRHVVESGQGREISADTPVLVSVTAFDGESASTLSPAGQPQLFVGRADETTLGPELLSVVVGAREGSRTIVVRLLEEKGRAPGATSPYEIDVVDVLPAIATGTEVPDTHDSPLSVKVGEEGPSISHGDAAPASLTTQLLLKGEGRQVTKDDRVVAQFIVQGWSDGQVRSSTWSTGVPELLALDDVMQGLAQSLVDQHVGSRLAITIPPDLATGDDTLCVVVDILGTEPPKQADDASMSGETSQS
ncbi:MAG: peptidylprolyl isomerase [Actinobacteria bacterium]|nr:MAG: peptidylprolyl isomerase [Actinomycetota bacterium]